MSLFTVSLTPPPYFFVFFFTYPTTTEIYTISLHDALPIYSCGYGGYLERDLRALRPAIHAAQTRVVFRHGRLRVRTERSEEHTSELQSPDHLVCRLLLEKKKI